MEFRQFTKSFGYLWFAIYKGNQEKYGKNHNFTNNSIRGRLSDRSPDQVYHTFKLTLEYN